MATILDPKKKNTQSAFANVSTGDGRTDGQATGTGFVNIDRYLDANQGSGEKLGNAIGKAADDASQAYDQAGQKFAGMNVDYKGPSSQEVNSFNDATKQSGLLDKSAASNFLQKYSGTTPYSGPSENDIQSSWDDMQGKKQTFDTYQNAFDPNTASGQAARAGMLNTTFGDKGYTSGMNSFDSLFLEQGGNAATQARRDALKAVGDKYASQDTRLSSLIDNAKAAKAGSDAFTSSGTQASIASTKAKEEQQRKANDEVYGGLSAGAGTGGFGGITGALTRDATPANPQANAPVDTTKQDILRRLSRR